MAELQTYVTPVFRGAFVNLFTPQPGMDGGEPKYGVTAIWDPSKFTASDKKKWQAIMSAMDTEAMNRFKKPVSKFTDNMKKGVRDGGEKDGIDGFEEGFKFANLTTKMKPAVVDREKGSDGKLLKIGPDHGNSDEVYAGAYFRATVTVYSYDNKGKGVALGLMNIQKIADGESLIQSREADGDFADEDIDAAWLEQEEDEEDFGA
jgi:hypothetical protein